MWMPLDGGRIKVLETGEEPPKGLAFDIVGFGCNEAFSPPENTDTRVLQLTLLFGQ